MNSKSLLKKLWWFIWKDDSIWSWIVNFVLAFILIKFIVYPGLGALLGTAYPVVAVVSGSMEHDNSFAKWWSSEAQCTATFCTQEQWYLLKNITEEDFHSFLFSNGFNKGDIMVLRGIKPQNIKIGDVIVFVNGQSSDPIIHRVVAITSTDFGYIFQTKGDHNADSGNIDIEIQGNAIIGKAVFRIPLLGWVKIVAVSLVSPFIM